MLAGLGRMVRAKLLGLTRRADVRFSPSEATRDNLNAIAGLLASGAITAVIDRSHTLEETPKAIAHKLGHHARGNIVITVPG